MTNIRRKACYYLERLHRRTLGCFRDADWITSAVVFAPHPDDEILGCGGVARRKILSSADVRFVFVTDGSASHSRLVPPATLIAMREAEAVDAVGRLGGAADRVTFLRFKDGTAIDQVDRIAEAIEPLLTAWRPQSVFLPHAQEPPRDHLAVNRGVKAALEAYGQPVTVFEYAVWYWYHWPWVRFGGDLPGMWRTTLRQTIRTAAGLRTMGTLNTLADVRDVLDTKREALAAHASQMRRPGGRHDWTVLADLSQGDFIARLMASYEAFTRYEVNGGAP